ncbi:hypothetical protein B0H34DRAFT_11968 [Crassisporium funariophilum]|nr:hypothetical protein B0H34DRAFT_11968 [Crassisporium funariophilum]
MPFYQISFIIRPRFPKSLFRYFQGRPRCPNPIVVQSKIPNNGSETHARPCKHDPKAPIHNSYTRSSHPPHLIHTFAASSTSSNYTFRKSFSFVLKLPPLPPARARPEHARPHAVTPRYSWSGGDRHCQQSTSSDSSKQPFRDRMHRLPFVLAALARFLRLCFLLLDRSIAGLG